jgi:hypothetical protein
MKYLKYSIPLMLIVNFCYSQDVKKEENLKTEIKALVENQRFQFAAQSASPMRGGSISLSPGYTFTVSPDTIISSLPYYGRAYQAPIDPSKAGYNFTSTDFIYALKERKKGGWDISIKPKDVTSSPQINLSISTDGYASVRIQSTDRQPISFRGVIQKKN